MPPESCRLVYTMTPPLSVSDLCVCLYLQPFMDFGDESSLVDLDSAVSLSRLVPDPLLSSDVGSGSSLLRVCRARDGM